MDNLFLIYINYIGKDYKHNHIYEFIFNDILLNVDNEGWDEVPASGRPEPPDEKHIKSVGRLESKLKLDVLQDSTIFAYWDGVDNIISIAWENIDDYETYPEHRLCFKFGEPIKDVEKKIYDKELTLKFEKKAYENQK